MIKFLLFLFIIKSSYSSSIESILFSSLDKCEDNFFNTITDKAFKGEIYKNGKYYDLKKINWNQKKLLTVHRLFWLEGLITRYRCNPEKNKAFLFKAYEDLSKYYQIFKKQKLLKTEFNIASSLSRLNYAYKILFLFDRLGEKKNIQNITDKISTEVVFFSKYSGEYIKKNITHNISFVIIEFNCIKQIIDGGMVINGNKDFESWVHTAFYEDGGFKELTLRYSFDIVQRVINLYNLIGGSKALSRHLIKIINFHLAMIKTNDLKHPEFGDLPSRNLKSFIDLVKDISIDKNSYEWVKWIGTDLSTQITAGKNFPKENTNIWSGYYSIRSGWSQLDWNIFIDAGPMGSNHRNADKLSFHLSVDGVDFIVQPGSHYYNMKSNDLLRINPRPGYMNNTISVNNRDLGRYKFENTKPKSHPRSIWRNSKEQTSLQDFYVLYSVPDLQDAKIKDDVWVIRRFDFIHDSLLVITDSLYATKGLLSSVDVEFNLQLDYNVEPSLQKDGNILISHALNNKKKLLLDLNISESKLAQNIVKGNKIRPFKSRFIDEIGGWRNVGRGWNGYRDGKQSSIPAPAIVLSGRVNLPFRNVIKFKVPN